MARFDRAKTRKQRHRRVRSKVMGTPEKPRLNVYRGLKNIHAQAIDDLNGHTLAHASTQDPELKEYQGLKNMEASAAVGKLIAQRVKDKGIKRIVFDRSGYKFHGRIKALADAVREEGIEF